MKIKNFIRPVLIVALSAVVCLYSAPWVFADALEVEVEIMPNHLKLSADDKPYINGHAWLPEGYDPADITECSLEVDDETVYAKRVKVCLNDPQQAVALFDRATVCAILSNAGAKGNVELTMTMVMADGTIFYGSDTIKVGR